MPASAACTTGGAASSATRTRRADLTRVTEQCAAGCADNGGIAGLVYRSQDFNINNTGSFSWKANVSYVTGSHSMKVGYQGTWMTDNRIWMTNDTQAQLPCQQRHPESVADVVSPYQNDGRAGWHAGFVQEQWSHGKLTLQGALRFDLASSWFPEQTLGPSKYFPNQIVFPATKGVDSYKDFTPRFGVRLRRVRQRPDGAEGELRQVPGRCRRLDELRQLQPDASHSDVDGCLRRAGRHPHMGGCR